MNVGSKLEHLFRFIAHKEPIYFLNINRNLLDKNQRRILLCYITTPLRRDLDKNIYHPNIPRCNQMITTLIKLGFSIDVCDANDISCFPYVQKQQYFAVLGFGDLYELVCSSMNIKYKIIYVTENDPSEANRKYLERLNYFYERHPKSHVDLKNKRLRFYTSTQFALSNVAIIMTNDFNSVNIRKQINCYFKIKCNGLYNNEFVFNKLNINVRRRHFLWFGSTGLVQKGLDILFDVFNKLPELTLDVCGVNSDELKSVKGIIPKNVNICGRINVFSKEFLNIVNSHLFVISASCLEGMQSGVSTCMRHGLIPLLTYECGYENQEFIFHFENYRVESIVKMIEEIMLFSDEELAILSNKAYEYANKEHTLESFTASFENIMKNINSM